MLDELKQQYAKLGDEITKIENNTSEKWVKVFSPEWRDGNGKTTRYGISYFLYDELYRITDYTILKEYSNRATMLNSLK